MKSRADAVRELRSKIAVAAVHAVKSPEELRFEQPLVEAFVRMHHHPLAKAEVGELWDEQHRYDFAPRLAELASSHPEAKFDLASVREGLIRAIRVNGDHELDDSQPPWLMHWGPSSFAATAFVFFVIVMTLGEITVSYDEAEKAEYDEAKEHHERLKNVKPLKLD